MIDLRPEHLRIVRSILEATVPRYDVWAFGSRVSGSAREFSDLDIVIVADQPIEFELLGRIRDEFSLSDLPFKVDVVDWASAPNFQKAILAHREILRRGA